MTGNIKRKKYHIGTILVLCLVLAFSKNIYAESAGVTLSANSTELEIGTSANLILEVHNNKAIKDIGLLGTEGFDILNSSQSISTQTINGKTTSKKTFNITIMPKASGRFTLKGVIQYDDGEEESNPVVLNVKEGSSNIQGDKPEVFIESSISKENCYFGERLVISYELYTRVNVDNYGFVDNISLDGFIVNEVPTEDLNVNYTMINGVKYLKYDAKKLIVIPTKSGEVTIPSYNFQVNLRTEDFFSRSKPMYLQTEELKINVQSIPEENKPVDFSGLVGKLDISASYDKDSVNYGQPVTLKVLLKGTVNMDNLGNLYPKENSNFTIYETPQNIRETVAGKSVVSSKEYEIIIVPKETGQLFFKPLKISYFDTDTKTYKYVEIPGKEINVTGQKSDDSDSTQIDNGNYNSYEVLEINQVNYNEENEDEVVIRINKKTVYIIMIVLIGALVALLTRLYLNNLFKKNVNRQLEIDIKKATSSEELYEIVYKFILEKYSVSIKSKSKKEIERVIDNPVVYKNICDAVDYLEHEKFYLNQDIEEAKKKILEYVKNAKKGN